MTTYQKIQEKTKEVEELEKQFNALHRKAKYDAAGTKSIMGQVEKRNETKYRNGIKN
jgi:hypothetical protein